VFRRSLHVPDGDILIHAGDYTSYGDVKHALDFNDWLGSLPHPTKIVINGNHESNSSFRNDVKRIISNAHYLVNEAATIECKGRVLKVYGVQFYFPGKISSTNPHYDSIPEDIDILICHCPVNGFVDGNKGCHLLRNKCAAISKSRSSRLKLVVSGHLHFAYGTTQGEGRFNDVTFVNASNCAEGRRKVVNPAIVMDWPSMNLVRDA
jgi:predicted phosphodiesterase